MAKLDWRDLKEEPTARYADYYVEAWFIGITGSLGLFALVARVFGVWGG